MSELTALYSELEKSAERSVSSKKKLQTRFERMLQMVDPDVRKCFEDAEIDFENKKLIGDGWVMTWKLRDRPGEPVSDTNPQSDRGVVEVVRVAGNSELS